MSNSWAIVWVVGYWYADGTVFECYFELIDLCLHHFLLSDELDVVMRLKVNRLRVYLRPRATDLLVQEAWWRSGPSFDEVAAHESIENIPLGASAI